MLGVFCSYLQIHFLPSPSFSVGHKTGLYGPQIALAFELQGWFAEWAELDRRRRMQLGYLVSWSLPSRSPRLTATTDLMSLFVQASPALHTMTSALPVTLHQSL